MLSNISFKIFKKGTMRVIPSNELTFCIFPLYSLTARRICLVSHGQMWPLTSEVSINPCAGDINSQEMLTRLKFISVSISKRTYLIKCASYCVVLNPVGEQSWKEWKGPLTESGPHLYRPSLSFLMDLGGGAIKTAGRVHPSAGSILK